MPTRVSGQLAFACYLRDDRAGAYLAHSVDVVRVRDGAVAGITAFLDDRWVRRLGLPARWPADGSRPVRRPLRAARA